MNWQRQDVRQTKASYPYPAQSCAGWDVIIEYDFTGNILHLN